MNKNFKIYDDDQQLQQKIDRIKSTIKSYPDFPKPGIIFRDIFPIFQNSDVLEDTISVLLHHIHKNNSNVQTIVGLESRGFLIGPLLSLKLKIPFIPIRKSGKLPGKVESISYDLEYGSDKFELQIDSLKPGTKCIIIDDLLATGGSAKSAANLIEKCGSSVIKIIVLIELIELKGREKFSEPIYSLVQF